MPRVPAAASTPSSTTRKRNYSTQTSPISRPSDRDGQRRGAKRARLGRGTDDVVRSDEVTQGRIAMTDPVQTPPPPARTKSSRPHGQPKARRMPTSENDPATLVPQSARPTNAIAPAFGLQSPFQLRSRTSSASARARARSSSLSSPSETGAERRGRARTASLRARPYPTTGRAPRPAGQDVSPSVEPVISLMARLLSTPMATSTPRTASRALAPVPRNDSMELDATTMLAPRVAWRGMEVGAAESDSPVSPMKTDARTATTKHDRRPAPFRTAQSRRKGDELSDMMSNLDLGEHDEHPTATAASPHARNKKYARATAHTTDRRAKKHKKYTGDDNLKTAAVGLTTPAAVIKTNLKKENVYARQHGVVKRPMITPLQSEHQTRGSKQAASIPMAAVRPVGVRKIAAVPKEFRQGTKQTAVWMKIREEPLQLLEDESSDEIAAFR